MSCIVAIVGRPNVGKSTLFNRLSRSRSALVDDQPGVTRDRLYATVQWEGNTLTIVDTGGFEDINSTPFIDQVKEQVLKAIEDADRIIFMVDGREGIMPGDEEIAHVLRVSGKKTFLAVNKIDGPEKEHLLSDFYKLGMEKAYPLSAAHGYGLRALMGDVVEGIESIDFESGEDKTIKVAVVGRPNAGKSSLINRILGSERLLVSETPGTTRDAVDTPFTMKGKNYLLIDTAGIRKRARVREKIDKFSMIKALKSIERCHIAVVVLDAGEGITEQDARICGYAFERHRGLFLALNKWDLVKKDQAKRKNLDAAIERQLQFVSFAPRLNISALTGEGVELLLDRIEKLYDQYSRRISTARVNKVLEEMVQKKPPPSKGRTRLKLLYATQTGTRPPTFVLFVNKPEMVHFSYQRFLVNQLRKKLGLDQTPIKIIFKKK